MSFLLGAAAANYFGATEATMYAAGLATEMAAWLPVVSDKKWLKHAKADLLHHPLRSLKDAGHVAGIGLFRSIVDPLGSLFDGSTGKYIEHNRKYTKQEALFQVALDAVFGGFGSQITKNTARMAKQVAEEAAVRAESSVGSQVLTENMKNAARTQSLQTLRQVGTTPSVQSALALTMLTNRMESAELAELVQSTTDGTVSMLPQTNPNTTSFAFRATADGPVEHIYTTFRPANTGALKTKAMLQQWTGRNVRGAGDLTVEAVGTVEQLLKDYPLAQVHLGGYSMGGATATAVTAQLAHVDRIVSATVFNPNTSLATNISLQALSAGTREPIAEALRKVTVLSAAEDAIPAAGIPLATHLQFDTGAAGMQAHDLSNLALALRNKAPVRNITAPFPINVNKMFAQYGGVSAVNHYYRDVVYPELVSLENHGDPQTLQDIPQAPVYSDSTSTDGSDPLTEERNSIRSLLLDLALDDLNRTRVV